MTYSLRQKLAGLITFGVFVGVWCANFYMIASFAYPFIANNELGVVFDVIAVTSGFASLAIVAYGTRYLALVKDIDIMNLREAEVTNN